MLKENVDIACVKYKGWPEKLTANKPKQMDVQIM